MTIFQLIKSPSDLVTTHEQTRAGFVSAALEKNKKASPVINAAKSLKVLASQAKTARDLLSIQEIRPALLTAAGLSDKAIGYFSEEDKDDAITRLIEQFLEPAGTSFVEEVVYRYLLIRGDSIGGEMRNFVGAIAQQKLIRTMFSNLSVMGIEYSYLNNETKKWKEANTDTDLSEAITKAIYWKFKKNNFVIAFNLKVPTVGNNVDICLFNSDIENYAKGKIVNEPHKFIMLGELKGGIDPAGADEHWKTGNTALNRIRASFTKMDHQIKTSFIAAAIENKMADEIFGQLKSKTLSYAINLNSDEQLVNYCDWIIRGCP